MGYYKKLPPRVCKECGFSASGGAFRKSFGRFWYGGYKCPKCGSKNTEVILKKQGANPLPT